MAPETPQQKKLIDKIEVTAALLSAQEGQAAKTRATLTTLMVQAKDAEVSSYTIAKAADLSQPRVMQIIARAREGQVPPAKRVSAKKLQDENADLRRQLQEAQDALKGVTDAGTANGTVDPGEPGADQS